MQGMKLVHKGSVKNIFKQDSEAALYFAFSNRYSVFDWGEMPDLIEKKGEALAAFTFACFKLLGKKEIWRKYVLPQKAKLSPLEISILDRLVQNGLSHHLLGRFDQNGKALGEHDSSEIIGVLPFQVLRPKVLIDPVNQNATYDYAEYESKPTKCLIPLEAIFRYALPEGSGLLKRIEKNRHDRGFLQDLELYEWPAANDRFDRAIVEYTTKLEPGDRNISKTEARRISGMSEAEFCALTAHVRLVSLCLREVFRSKGIDLQDGKFEFGMGEMNENEQREIILLDSIGPDELRLEINGVQLSKEVLRKYYRKSEWFKKWENFKLENKDMAEWKELARKKIGAPEALDMKFTKLVSDMYCGLANLVCEMAEVKKPFTDCRPLNDTARAIKECL